MFLECRVYNNIYPSVLFQSKVRVRRASISEPSDYDYDYEPRPQSSIQGKRLLYIQWGEQVFDTLSILQVFLLKSNHQIKFYLSHTHG